MPVLPENVLVVYRENDDGSSYEFAQYYAAIHNISAGQLLPVTCSSSEIITYSEFQSSIEDPILVQLTNEYSPYFCVVLSFGVPGGFTYLTDIISSTSRISNIFTPIGEPSPNPLYNRQSSKVYSETDGLLVPICSRFDAPTLAVAKAQVDRCRVINRTGAATGKFYFDSVAFSEYSTYSNDLTEFDETILPILNMKTFRTVPDTVTDVPLFRMKDESFVWSWKTDVGGYTYFEENRYPRIFFYNATESGSSVRDATNGRLPMLAISSGYTGCAGAIGDVVEDDYLRPKPFFEALLRGATIGEAYIFALPNLDSALTLYGDPLVKVRFPIGIAIDDSISEASAYSEMADEFASSVAFGFKYRDILRSVSDELMTSQDITVKGELFPSAANMAGQANGMQLQGFPPVTAAFLSFPLTEVNSFLDTNDLKVSRLINQVSTRPVVSSANFYDTGSWYLETEIINAGAGFSFYHFEIEISNEPTFLAPYLIIHSADSVVGFYYEKSKDQFVAMTTAGVTSNFAGRRIKYISPTTETSGTIFYARIRQVDQGNNHTDWVTSTQIVFT